MIMEDLIKGVQSLHAYGQFHLNINPDVIMVYKEKEEYKVKLLDFFLSRDASNESVVPLRRLNDPLMFSGPKTNPVAADIFSLGVCFFFACTKSNPFERDDSETEENILDEDYKIDYRILNFVKLLDEYRKLFVMDVVTDMLKNKITLSCVLKHPFFWNTNKINRFLINNQFKLANPQKYFEGKKYENIQVRNHICK